MKYDAQIPFNFILNNKLLFMWKAIKEMEPSSFSFDT